MNNLIEPDHLNLDEASRKEVDAIIARLLNQQIIQHQIERESKIAELENKKVELESNKIELDRKTAEIKNKDQKIQVLTLK